MHCCQFYHFSGSEMLVSRQMGSHLLVVRAKCGERLFSFCIRISDNSDEVCQMYVVCYVWYRTKSLYLLKEFHFTPNPFGSPMGDYTSDSFVKCGIPLGRDSLLNYVVHLTLF